MIQCHGCKKEIEEGATICPHCGTKTSSINRQVSFWGQTIGYIVVIASAMTYLAGQIAEYWKYYTWEDKVELLTFNEHYVSIANIGDGEVFIRGIEHNLSIANHYLPLSTSVQLNIPSKKVNTRIFEQNFPQSEWATVNSYESKAELLKHSDPKYEQCISRVYRLKTEPSYSGLVELGITAIDTESKIHYFSTERGEAGFFDIDGLVLGFVLFKNSACEHFTEYHSCLVNEERKGEPNLEGRVSGCSSKLRRTINRLKSRE